MKKLNPFYLSGPDSCRQPNPATECEFRNSGRVLEAELLPGQDYCDICRCKLLAYVEEPIVVSPPPPPNRSWLTRNGRWLALGLVALLGALWFLLRPVSPVIIQQCDGYDLYEYVDGVKAKLLAKNSTSCGYKEPVTAPVTAEPIKPAVRPVKRKPKPRLAFRCDDGERIEFTYDASGNITRMLNTHQPCN